jgi:hypothetical protein
LFTSDVHWKGDNDPGIFDTWMPKMVTNIPTGVEYMCWLGDHAWSNNNETYTKHWISSELIMKRANKYVDSGFIKNKNVYIYGNHEWNIPASGTHGGDYNRDSSSWAAQQIEENHTTFETDNYVIYVLGPIYTPPPSDGCLQQFVQGEIDKLQEYLEGTASTVPLFVIAHHPIHSISSRSTQGRPDNLVKLLNEYSEQRDIYFLWGHNHSQNPKDPLYDSIYYPGSDLRVMQNGGTSYNQSADQTIQFTYIAAGCLSDAEYTGSYLVIGKAVLAVITDGAVSFTFYDKDATAFAPREVGRWSAGQPTISVQPVGATYTQSNSGGTITVSPAKTSLSVTAALPSGESPAGTLSYQWYYSAVSATDAGTAIQGAASATYDLANLDLTAPGSVGNHYYYVRVTNTNNNATGGKTAFRDSNRATVTVREGNSPIANYNYTITGGGASFTATGGTLAPAATGTMAQVLTAIRTDAVGNDVEIEFAGTSAVTATAEFSGTGWGAITLKGSITSDLTGATTGTVTIGGGVSVKIVGTIINTNTTNNTTAASVGKAVYISGASAVEVAEGATVTAGGGNALYHAGSGTVTISGGTLTSANQSASGTGATYSAGTVCCTGNTANLIISGGTVRNTNATNGFGVYMNSVDTTTTMLTLKGGTIDIVATRAVSIIYSTSVTFEGAGTEILNGKQIYVSNGNTNLWGNGKYIAGSDFAPGSKTWLLAFGGTALTGGRVIVEGGASFVNNFYKGAVGTAFTVTGNDLTY